MYCSHIGLLYYPQTFQLSPLVSFYEVLAARGGDVYEPSYFRMFQLSPLVVSKRSQQPKVELHGRELADEFCLKMPDFQVTFKDLLHDVNLRHRTEAFTSLPKECVLRIFCHDKSNSFCRVCTRELGYQRPARYLQTTEAALLFPSVFQRYSPHALSFGTGHLAEMHSFCDTYYIFFNSTLQLLVMINSRSLTPFAAVTDVILRVRTRKYISLKVIFTEAKQFAIVSVALTLKHEPSSLIFTILLTVHFHEM